MSLEIPEKCLTCPHVIKDHTEINQLEERKDTLIKIGVTDNLSNDGVSIHSRDTLFHTLIESLPPEEQEKKMREMFGKIIDVLDGRIEFIRSALAITALNCTGPLLLHGQDDDTIYTASICRAPVRRIPSSETEATAITQIKK